MKGIDRTALRSFILSDSEAMFFGGINENREKRLFGGPKESRANLKLRLSNQIKTKLGGKQ